MKGDPEQRAVQLGEYIAANRALSLIHISEPTRPY